MLAVGLLLAVLQLHLVDGTRVPIKLMGFVFSETSQAVFLLNPLSHGRGVEYRHYFVANPSAVKPLPAAVLEGLKKGDLARP